MHLFQIGKYQQQVEQYKGDNSALQKRHKDSVEEVNTFSHSVLCLFKPQRICLLVSYSAHLDLGIWTQYKVSSPLIGVCFVLTNMIHTIDNASLKADLLQKLLVTSVFMYTQPFEKKGLTSQTNKIFAKSLSKLILL